MKFNNEELKQFKKDLAASLKELSDKYNIDITLGKIAVVDDMFSIRMNAEHRLVKKAAAAPAAPVAKAAPKAPVKPAPVAKPAAKPTKKLDDISDKDLENLDLDDLDLDFDEEPAKAAPKAASKPAPAPKPEAKPAKKKLEDLTDEELANIDFDDIDFGDEEEKEVKPKRRKSSYEDDDSRYDQELERYLNPGKKVSYDREPKSVFEENNNSKHTYDDDISDDEIDAYLAQSDIFDYSFQAKLIQGRDVQDYYTDMKNLLLSNDGVKSKVMWDFDVFTYKGKPIARLAIEGEKLLVYLALDPLDYEDSSYNVKKVNDPMFAGTKLLAEIESMNDEDQMYDLIGDLAEAHNILPGEDRYDDYHFQYETNEELIARGLIKEN